MKKKVLLHAFILIFVCIFLFFWSTNASLADYSLQLTAILLLSLLFSRRLMRPSVFKLVESVVSTMTVLLVVSATGGITSPLFFLNYFLLFELSLLLEPVIPLILSFFLIFFYLLSGEVGISPLYWVEFLAFPFMTPLAYLFGKIYQNQVKLGLNQVRLGLKEENQKKEIKNLSKKVEELEEELVEEEIKIQK
jgi:hypothetical protein